MLGRLVVAFAQRARPFLKNKPDSSVDSASDRQIKKEKNKEEFEMCGR